MTPIVRVTAPSRLHFGLLRFAQQQGTSYGGLGMAIDQPRTVVELQPSPAWQAEGPMAQRALAFAKLAASAFKPEQESPLSIRVCASPQPHSGLGTGTQLALALAHGIRKLWQLPPLEAAALSASVDRGKRSAVGTHAFLQGGLIWETGQTDNHSLGTLSKRIAIPAEWRVLLISLTEKPGLHGDREQAAFKDLPPIPAATTQQLIHLAETKVLPAADTAHFSRFASAVHDYGQLAGSCFAAVQGGTFASPTIEQLVDQLRKLGIQGVGQSSWGPTVFALAEDDNQAEGFADQVQKLCGCKVQISTSNNQGVTVQSTNR